MTDLDQTIANAFASEGKQDQVNKVYLTLLRTPLFIPVTKNPPISEEEPFAPLFARIEDQVFMMAFDTLERLSQWAGEELANIAQVQITGRELITGINEGVHLCLNFGTEYYKEFSPDEVKQLKKIVSKIDQLKSP